MIYLMMFLLSIIKIRYKMKSSEKVLNAAIYVIGKDQPIPIKTDQISSVNH